MSNPKIRFKFEKFLKLLEDLQKTTTWVQMFRWRRALVIGSNLLRNILNLFDFLKVSSNWLWNYKIQTSKSIFICSYLYITPSSNIEKFNCPIPPEMHYSTELADGRRVEVTTEIFYYSAFQLRRGLIFMIIILHSLLVIGAMLLWKFVGSSEKS